MRRGVVKCGVRRRAQEQLSSNAPRYAALCGRGEYVELSISWIWWVERSPVSGVLVDSDTDRTLVVWP